MLFGGIVSSKVDRLVKLLDFNEQHQSTKGVILHFAFSSHLTEGSDCWNML